LLIIYGWQGIIPAEHPKDEVFKQSSRKTWVQKLREALNKSVCGDNQRLAALTA
jgi:hypothetical protein